MGVCQTRKCSSSRTAAEGRCCMADVEVLLPTGGAERRAESPDTTELAPAKNVAQLKASYNNSSSTTALLLPAACNDIEIQN